jgi:hypothetical protein
MHKAPGRPARPAAPREPVLKSRPRPTATAAPARQPEAALAAGSGDNQDWETF